jgi:hypothetical protein
MGHRDVIWEHTALDTHLGMVTRARHATGLTYLGFAAVQIS